MQAPGFTLLDQLGAGATATVWRALDAHGVERALKVLKPGSAATASQALLMREIQAVTRLRHSNIVHVVDSGVLVGAVGDCPVGSAFLVMELADAGSLASVDRLPWPVAQQVARSLLAGLGHAHARGFLHLDVKPANVVLFREPAAVKLADFGIARGWLKARDRAGNIEGTLQFMAPEQLRGDQHLLGPWTDLFALGVMLFRLCTGVMPYRGSIVDVLAQYEQKATPTSKLLTHEQNAWFGRLLACDPADRFHFARAAADALDAIDDVGAADAVNVIRLVDAAANDALTEVLSARDAAATEAATVVTDVESDRGRAPSLFAERNLVAAFVDDAADALVEHLDDVGVGAGRSVVVRGRDDVVARVLRHSREALLERGIAWPLVIPVEDDAAVPHAVADFIGLQDVSDAALVAARLRAMGFPLDDAGLCAVQTALQPTVADLDRRRALRVALIALNACQRVVVYVDDVENDAAALDLAGEFLAAGVQVVVGLGEGDAVANVDVEGTARRLRSLHAREIRVERSSGAKLTAALREALRLSPTATRLIAAFSDGNPEAALDMLRDGRRRGWLIDHEGSWSIVGDNDYDVDAYCAERVAAALAPWSGEEALALERAAILGLTVNEAEWRASLPQFAPMRLSDLLQQCDDLGLLRWTPTSKPPRFRLTHPGFRAVLVRRSDDKRRRSEHHRACAATIGGVRAARHLLAAGDVVEARALYRSALHDALVAGDEALSRQLFDEMLARNLGGDDDDALAAWVLVLDRRIDEARRRLGANSGGVAEFVRGLALSAEGHYDDAVTALRLSVGRLPVNLVEHARYCEADALYYAGHNDKAEAIYAMLWATTQQHHMRVRSGFARAWMQMVRGDVVGARRALLDVEREANVGGATVRDAIQIENMLGELARNGGDLKDAEQRYRRVLLRMRSVGDSSLAIGLSNLVVTLVDRGSDDEAAALAREVLGLLEHRELRGPASWPLLIAAVALLTSETARAVTLLERVAALIGDTTELDFAGGCDRAARRALAVDEPAIATVMAKHAVRQWRALDRGAAADALVDLFSLE